MTARISRVSAHWDHDGYIIICSMLPLQRQHHNNTRSVDLTKRSWVGFEWALPGVVVGIVVPFSVSVGDALELFVSDVVVGVSVWSWSVDTLLTRNGHGWLVDEHGGGLGGEQSYDGGNDEGFHF